MRFNKIVLLWAVNFFLLFFYCQSENPNFVLKKITDNLNNDYLPVSKNNILVWRSVEPEDSYINIKDGEQEVKKIKAALCPQVKKQLFIPAVVYGPLVPSYISHRPAIGSNEIAWTFFDGKDNEICLYKSNRIFVITDNEADDNYPVFWQDGIVWCQYDGEDYELMYCKNSIIKQLTENNANDYAPSSDGITLVWEYYQYETDRWDLKILGNPDDKPEFFTLKTQDGKIIKEQFKERTDPFVDGSDLVYSVNMCDEYKIRYYNGKDAFYLTMNPFRNGDAYIKNSRIVWKDFNTVNMKYDIFYRDSTIPAAKDINGKTTVLNVSSSSNHSFCPVINEKGEIFYSEFDGVDYEIIKAVKK